MVHGSSGGLDSFDPITPLVRNRRWWGYARRGYAPSGGCAHPKVFADDVADLRAVIEAVGEPVDVLGASYGAIVALHCARDDDAHRTALRSLVLFEPPLFAAGPDLEGVLARYRTHLERSSLGAAARLFAAEVAQVPRPLLDALMGADDADVTAPGDADEGDRAAAVGCLHDLEAMTADSGDLDRWAAVTAPTLLLQGSDTWAPMPATMDALAERLPRVRRAVLTGQTHFATHTAPEAFAEAVNDFLAAA
nr:alpha/beta hydrolase [Kineococcus siccus]